MDDDATMPDDGVGAFLGFEWNGDHEVRLSVRPELLNQAGRLSGVVAYALVDYGMGATLWPHTTDDEMIATLTIAITYLATAREGVIVCRSWLDRRTRATAALRSEVTRESGELLATAVGSFAIYRRRP